MDYQIREIKESDNTPLSKIIKGTLEELGCAMDGTVYTDAATDHLSFEYQKDRTIYYVAVSSEGELLGGSGIGPIAHLDKNYCELQKMYLTKDARGKGIGAALMEKCIEFARSAGYELVYIETFGSMKDAQKLYQKFGFEQIDHSLGDTGHFSCDVKMVLQLS